MIAKKSDVMSWESVDEAAHGVDVQIGSVTRYVIVQMGLYGEVYETRDEAQEEADRINAEADEECDYDVVGDGAASVDERIIWFVRAALDDAGTDDADDTAYETRDEAEAAAEALAESGD